MWNNEMKDGNYYLEQIMTLNLLTMCCSNMSRNPSTTENKYFTNSVVTGIGNTWCLNSGGDR